MVDISHQSQKTFRPLQAESTTLWQHIPRAPVGAAANAVSRRWIRKSSVKSRARAARRRAVDADRTAAARVRRQDEMYYFTLTKHLWHRTITRTRATAIAASRRWMRKSSAKSRARAASRRARRTIRATLPMTGKKRLRQGAREDKQPAEVSRMTRTRKWAISGGLPRGGSASGGTRLLALVSRRLYRSHPHAIHGAFHR